MNNRTKYAAIAGTSLVALSLVGALAQADSMHYAKVMELNTDIEAAAVAALSTVPGTIIEAELELDDKLSVWEFEIVTDANQIVEVVVDGYTGNVLQQETSDDVAPDVSNAVSLQQTLEMVNALENGVLIEMELEADDDSLVWELEMVSEDNKETEIKVDATTGELL